MAGTPVASTVCISWVSPNPIVAMGPVGTEVIDIVIGRHEIGVPHVVIAFTEALATLA